MTNKISLAGLLALLLASGFLVGCGDSGGSNTERPLDEVEAELAPAE